jgi:hypothetical protein
MPPKKKDEKKEELDAAPLVETGTYVFEAFNNARYNGQIVRRDGVARRNGQGTFADGSISYDGNWKDDVMHGDGKISFADGATYVGSFTEGTMDGTGIYRWPDGSHYDGQWRCNRMHGEGTYTDADGQVWKGKFYNGTGPGLRKSV